MRARWSFQWFLPLVLASVVIMAAAMILGYYSYRAVNRMAAETEETLKRSNRVVGEKVIDRIEKMIIGTDWMLFQMVRLDDPKGFQDLWRRIVRVSPVVKNVVVLDESLNVIHLLGKRDLSSLDKFRHTFLERIVPDMNLKRLPRNAHRHLHKLYDGKSYLISYIRRLAGQRDYYIAISMNLDHIRKHIFTDEFKKLEQTKFVAVVDQDGRVQYGSPVPRKGAILFEQRFPTTLYRWWLQLSPKEVGPIRKAARTRQYANLALVAAADVLILIGLLIVIIAVRRERRASQLMSDFVSNVTHELKTPLSLIRMFGELLSMDRSASPETAREYAEIITRESDRLAGLIDNVLDFSRIERGKAAYRMTRGNLTHVVERAVELVRYRADQAGVELRSEIEPNLPDTLFDLNALTLLLLNLLENALRYGASEGGRIVVNVARKPEGLALAVSDNGPGIPKEEIPRLFERFFRGSTARGRSVRGSGIGLSLVKYIAEAHNGRVTVNSSPGEGTTFEVVIPIRFDSPSTPELKDQGSNKGKTA